MPAYSDEQLVLEALEDSHPAFEQLVKHYQHRVLRTIGSIISDEQAVQDVAQETFLSAWSDLAKLKEKHKFGKWLNQIAINLSRLWLRDQRKHNADRLPLEENAVVLTEELKYQRDKLRQAVWDAIDELAEGYREIVILHYISGYSYKEISEMLSIPHSTIVGRLQEARNQLRKEFLDMVTKLQLEIDSTVHKFLKQRAKQDGLSIEGLIIRLIERYKRDADATGAIARQTWDNAQDFMGQVSPDGRYLSYVNWDTGGDLAIHDFETKENRDITDQGDSAGFGDASIWSPDSKQIAYLWFEAPEWSTSLRVVGIDGSKPRILYSSPPESGALCPRAWSRDGKHILALDWKKEGETYDIVLVSVADSSIRVLKSLEKLGGSWLWLSPSPDGRYVAYDYPHGEDSPDHDIFLVATDRSHEMALVEHPANDFAPFWAPDGNRIVFASDRSGSVGVWVLEVVDGKPKGSPHFIIDNLNGMYPLGLTQDGSYYYGLPSRRNDIYFADLDPETSKVVKPPYKAIQTFEGLNSQPDFSPDGKRLVYLSERGPGGWRRSISLVVRSLETGEERELQTDPPLELLSARSAPCWSPDGHSILVVARANYLAKERRNGIHQIYADTGAVTHVVWNDGQGGISARPPVWFPDGSKIFFKRRGFIWIYDFETKREWKLDFKLACGEGYPYGLAISPDGQHLAFMISCDDEWSLQIAPSSGGDTRETVRLRKEEIAGVLGLTWTPDERNLLFLGNPKDEANGLCELWRIPVEGGEPQNLDLTMKLYTHHTHLSIHPDGSRIAFTGPGPRPGAEVWAMENFLPTASR